MTPAFWQKVQVILVFLFVFVSLMRIGWEIFYWLCVDMAKGEESNDPA